MFASRRGPNSESLCFFREKSFTSKPSLDDPDSYEEPLSGKVMSKSKSKVNGLSSCDLYKFSDAVVFYLPSPGFGLNESWWKINIGMVIQAAIINELNFCKVYRVVLSQINHQYSPSRNEKHNL